MFLQPNIEGLKQFGRKKEHHQKGLNAKCIASMTCIYDVSCIMYHGIIEMWIKNCEVYKLRLHFESHCFSRKDVLNDK